MVSNQLVVTPSLLENNLWTVGNPNIPEAIQDYYVTYDSTTARYSCECRLVQTPSCQHVIAVLLYKKNHPSNTNSNHQDTMVGVGETLGQRLPSEPLSDSPIPQVEIPDPHNSIFGVPQLPQWLTEFRPHQWDAIQEVMQKFAEGNKVVFLDAPTGSGKTLIAESVRRLLKLRGLYVCSTKTLQDQFTRDYPYSAVLKGRSNYPTIYQPFPEYTAADCTKSGLESDDCYWCPSVHQCAYEQAKSKAYSNPVAVLNTSYLLTEANYIGGFSGRDLVILDECDVIERELMGFVEFNLSERLLSRLGLVAPKKGVHKKTIAQWIEEVLIPSVKSHVQSLPGGDDIRSIRTRKQLTVLLQDCKRILPEIEHDNWIRDNDAGPLVLKPIRIDQYGQSTLWRHSPRWLCMSATIISPDEIAHSLGLDGNEEQEGVKWDTVRVPMTFPVENRRIHVAPVANMVDKEKEQAWPKLADAISSILERHPDERILIHTVSYKLTSYLQDKLYSSNRVISYKGSDERDRVLGAFRSKSNAVLLAPSFDRGVDLAGDDCRVIVVTKIPYPSLGDKQVSARLNSGREGQIWYSVQTIRSLVQMTGRGVRSEDDWCTTYILDKQFVSNVWKKNKGLLPAWWAEALDMRFPVRQLQQGRVVA